MALSIFNEKPKSHSRNDDYVVNYYHTKKYDNDHYLITVNHGSWVVLDKREFDLLRFNRLDEDKHLKSLLEETGIILTNNNRNFILTATKNKFQHTQRGTSLHILVPTLRCNQKCIYCHAKSMDPSKKGYDMTKETAKKVVDFMFQSPAKGITIEYQGGEPTLNMEIVKFIRDYSEEVNKKHKKDVRWVIVTNFTNLDEEKINYFIEKKIDLCTSLDGPEELHNHNRPFVGGGSTYKDVIKTIKICRDKGIEMGALPTITKESLKYSKEIVDEYIKQGFSSLMSRNLNFMGFAKQIWSKLGYTPKEYLDFFKEQMDYILEINKKGFPFIDVKLKFILQRMLSTDPRTFTCYGSPCGAVIGQIAYDQDGNIFTCDEARSDDVFKIGSVHTHTYADIMRESACKVVDLTSGLSDVCDNCVWHPYCGTCMVAVYGAQGNVVSKHAWDHECKIREFQADYLMRKMIYDKDARAIFQHWAFPNKFPFPFRKKKLSTQNERERFILEELGSRGRL
ncbi:MAG: His-Xaa-Ser system radical SAM maturase HxsB [Nanoarchaeota archaeon]|nr:His-Xaa-Ser system radical SAM maturase HxsB [Nanoarchaeota archaeon]MBU1854163.1 His-Xaa-Ser system radical SAM maturase HxsB [Nanoarchaeota archaeon]